MMKPIIFLILLFCCSMSSAQQNSQLQPDDTKIDSKLLVGFWESADSVKYRIEFVDLNGEVQLTANVGVTGGYDFRKDSMNRVSATGCGAAWPPFYCGLKFITPDTLELVTWHLGSDVVKSKYVRVKE